MAVPAWLYRVSMRKRALVAFTAMFALTGCASAPLDSTYGPTVGEESTQASPSLPTESPVRNERGNIVKATGEPMRIGAAGDTGVLAEFAVTSIVVGPSCTGDPSVEPENGFFVQFNFEGRTAPDLQESVKLDPSVWTAVDDQGELVDGQVGSAAATSCLEANAYLPTAIGPGESVHGAIVFDVPTPSGALVLTGPNALTGIEWAYPQE